ncbi:unnamed protein product [Rotaria sordida]|uniref:Uncharacterized protein n=1 Tax=Rotaria sordida TaxID=392033 RepID=A0A813XZB3_9BILA|nr:unnamed protein product [Rotaria sordida]
MQSITNNDEDFICNKENSNVSSLSASPFSSTLSLIENNDDDDDGDQNEDMELFPQLKTNQPRLAMQISHQY